MKIEELPLSVCEDCLMDHTQEDKRTGNAHCFCSHNQAGATYEASEGKWATICPITEAEFHEHVERVYWFECAIYQQIGEGTNHH